MSYKSKAQKTRIFTEPFVEENFYCPYCGANLISCKNNDKVRDFDCSKCNENYELKSKQGKNLGKTVPDGAYDSMIDWNETVFLKESNNIKSKGWLLDIMQCIEKLEENSFSLSDLYSFENYLKIKHPENNNIQAKIRQQLQLLRDKDFLEFYGRGKYKLR